MPGNTRKCDVVIVIPTLNLLDAAKTAKAARDSAGLKCGVIIAGDQEKRGAVVVSNVLLRAAIDWGAKYIAYVNDDVVGFTQGWLKRLIEAVDSNPEYGSASAGGKCRGGPQKDCKPNMSPGIIATRHPLAWFCTVIKSEVFSLGFWDEEMIHYADESDFQFRMVEAGYLNVCVQDVYVEHKSGAVNKVWWEHDIGRLRKKWNL
jgi:GT2 family glycosyltransferase